ncbi:MAG: thioredoxin domain-containing protein [Desulfurococcales archaeon]|nr:thioredoxin domain-containing protein [Desulfurococcales archaeon]
MRRRRTLRLKTRQRVKLIHLTLIALVATLALGVALSNLSDTSIREGGVVRFDSSPSEYYEVVSKYDTVIVYVEQEGCIACKKIEPHVYDFAEKHPDITVLEFSIDKLLEKDPDKTLQLISDLGIRGTPTFIVYKHGEEVARHEGLFDGDQNKGLESLASSKLDRNAAITGFGLGAAFVMGLVASFSPCNVSLLAVYVASQPLKKINKWTLLASNVLLVSIVLAGGLGLGFLAMTSLGFMGIPVSTLLLLFSGWLIMLWGIMEYRGFIVSSKAVSHFSKLLPPLGLQCSLPFLLVAISLAPLNPVAAFASSLVFSLGFSIPYMVAHTTLGVALKRVAIVFTGRWRGLVLTFAGFVVLLYTVIELF